ncbi:hypothetical protein HDU79_004424 [Rhizoclosmatium sp. JEL0117]|nr:hypothetical protein HDU79_004424 [Rhizoclosmatium sp. JEL0117]
MIGGFDGNMDLDALLHKYASASKGIFENASSLLEAHDLGAKRLLLMKSIDEKRLINQNRYAERILKVERGLATASSIFTPNRNALKAKYTEELEAVNRDKAVLEQSILVDQNELRELEARIHKLNGTNGGVSYQAPHLLLDMINKILSIKRDSEEQYYSRILDRAIKQFFKLTTEANSIRAAIKSVERGYNLMKWDTYVSSDNPAALEDMFFALHFLDLAHSYWPKLKRVEFPPALEKNSFANASARLQILQTHMIETKRVLLSDQSENQGHLETTRANLTILGDHVAAVRLRVLETSVQSIGIHGRVHVSGTSRLIFKQDALLLNAFMNGDAIADSEEVVGIAVGQLYADLGPVSDFVATLPPSYD